MIANNTKATIIVLYFPESNSVFGFYLSNLLRGGITAAGMVYCVVKSNIMPNIVKV